MGYCIHMQDSNFFIPVSKVQPALKAIQALHGRETISDSGGRHFSWVDQNFHEIDSFERMMEEWRYPVGFDDDGNVNYIGFGGEKLGDEEILFEAIAPFVKRGSFLEMQGEDGSLWRWIFDGETCREVNATITWDG